MPHGHCYLWDSRMVWLHVLSDGLTALAYFSIPVVLLIFVRKRKDLDFSWIFVWFAAFIVSCGLSHVAEIFTIWVPVYWLQGTIKAITAISSAMTAILLIKMLPAILALPSPSAFRKANEDLQMANKELEAFSYSVSHDLRAPLRAIEGFSKLLVTRNAQGLNEDAIRMLGIVRSETQRMNQLIEDLLGFARILRVPMTCGKVDMEALARETYAQSSALEPERKIDFKLDGLPNVTGEAGMLRQVWVKLISNAIKFTRPRETAEIEITSQDGGKEIIFSIKDNGVGFDMTYSEKLFGVFQRLHSQQEFEGTGVGLALVQRILQRHGGKIWATAEPDKGATFYFSMPKEGNS